MEFRKSWRNQFIVVLLEQLNSNRNSCNFREVRDTSEIFEFVAIFMNSLHFRKEACGVFGTSGKFAKLPRSSNLKKS